MMTGADVRAISRDHSVFSDGQGQRLHEPSGDPVFLPWEF